MFALSRAKMLANNGLCVGQPPLIFSSRTLMSSEQGYLVLLLNSFRANQLEFGQVFDNLTFKHMDALKERIQPLVDYVLNYCFWIQAILSKY